MATNPRWRVPLGTWQRYFRAWIDEPETQALADAIVFFDFRQLNGTLDAEAALRPVVRAAAGNRVFLARLARMALRRESPLDLTEACVSCAEENAPKHSEKACGWSRVRGIRGGGVAAMAERIRVLIADHHPATRAGVRAVLEDDGFQVCAEVADAGAAVKAAVRERPDLCLVDVHVPGNGIAAAQAIISSLPDTAVVMLAVSRNDDDLFDALRAGAVGYLPKETRPERLPHALRGVLAGEAALPRHLVARVIQDLRERGRRRRLPLLGRQGVELTSREWEVLDLLCEGLSTHEMAERLFVSHATIRTHVAAVVKKLRVPHREAAVRLLEGR